MITTNLGVIKVVIEFQTLECFEERFARQPAGRINSLQKVGLFRYPGALAFIL